MARSSRKMINVQPPLAGKNAAWGYQSQPPFSMADCVNVRCRDTFENRQRLASRPFLRKAFAEKLGVSGGGGTAVTTVFYPTKDLRISSLDPTVNYNANQLLVGYAASVATEYRTILHFNLSAIPASATITGATLFLVNAGNYAYNNASFSAWLRRLTQTGWSETLGTWNKYDGVTNWIAAGGDYTTTGQISWTLTPLSSPGNTTIEGLESLVDDAIDNRSSQLHIILMKDLIPDTGQGRNSWQNREFSEPLTTFTPRLTVTYEEGAGAGTPGSPIRLLNVCRSVNSDAATSYLDEFTTAPLPDPPWKHGAWTLNGVVSSGIPTVSSGTGYASTNAVGLQTAKLADQTVSTNAYREVSAGMAFSTAMNANTTVWLLMDMDVTTPATSASIILRAFKNTGGTRILQLSVNSTLVASISFVPSYASSFSDLRVSIDTEKVVRCYWSSPSTADITYTTSGYTAAGGRVGFGLDQGTASLPSLIRWFKYVYTSSSGAVPPRCLCVSAGGIFYRQNTDGTIDNVTSETTPTPSLASDRLLSSAAYLQKLYIADYGKKTSGTAGVVASSTSFTDSGKNFTTLGVDADDDRLEIISATGSTVGIYGITTVSGTTITLSTSPGNGTAITYRIIRAPKVWDSASPSTLALVPIGTPGAPGTQTQFPLGCTIVVAWLERLVWAGDPDNPTLAYLSKAGDATNYLYTSITGIVAGQAFAFDPARSDGSSGVGDTITAVIRHSDDYLLFCGKTSVSILRGDPTLGGRLDLVTRDVGIIDKKAWCYTPEGLVVGMSTDGIYLFEPGPRANPKRISKEVVPAELLNLDTALYEVQLEYDLGRDGIKIFITPKSVGITTHWWFDWKHKAFYPDTHSSDHDATATCTHMLSDSATPVIIYGCRDGYLRIESDSATTDDGETVGGWATLGPFNLGHPMFDGIIHEVFCEMARNSGSVRVDVKIGDSAEEAYFADVSESHVFGPGMNPLFTPRRRGGACFLRVFSSGGVRWAVEALAFNFEILGRLRVSS